VISPGHHTCCALFNFAVCSSLTAAHSCPGGKGSGNRHAPHSRASCTYAVRGGVNNVLFYPSDFEASVDRVPQPQDDDRPLPRRTLARISHTSAASGLPSSEQNVGKDGSGTMLGITHAQLQKLQLADIANMLLPDRTNSLHSQSGGLPCTMPLQTQPSASTTSTTTPIRGGISQPLLIISIPHLQWRDGDCTRRTACHTEARTVDHSGTPASLSRQQERGTCGAPHSSRTPCQRCRPLLQNHVRRAVA
jgi:hypothetical protein